MKTPFRSIIMSAFIVFSTVHPAMASDEISLKDIVETVLANHPDLALSRIAPRIAATEKEQVQGQLDAVVSGRGGYVEDHTPVSSDFSPNASKIIELQGNASKPLASGGTLSFGANYTRTDLSFNSPLAAQLASINPAYRNQADISYRHPLLRGAGRPAYHQAMISADANSRAAALQSHLATEQLLLRTLNLYYQMASNEINVELSHDALLRAEELLAYQRHREEFGLIEAADRLQAEALLASRKMEHQKAQAALAHNRAELNRLMLRSPESPLSTKTDNTENKPVPALAEAMSVAEENRPELQAQAVRLTATDARLAAAKDTQKMQMDVVASVGGRGLNDQAGAALAQGFTLDDRFVSVGLEFSDTIGRHSSKASIRKAELEKQQILLEREQSLERIKDEIVSALTSLQTGAQTLDSANQRTEAEQRKYAAELQRYRNGRSDTATIVQFEGELRFAELAQAIEAIELQRAYDMLLWAEGTLLTRLGLLWPDAGEDRP